MKLIGTYDITDNQGRHTMRYMVWPDSVMIRTGKPVFLDPDRKSYVHFCVGAKIEKVGKSIQEKFAERYYHETTIFAVFLPEEASDALMAGRDPKACDIVTDYCIIVGDPMDANKLKTPFLDGSISEVSRLNTLKTGDYVFHIMPDFRLETQYNENLIVKYNDAVLLSCKIK